MKTAIAKIISGIASPLIISILLCFSLVYASSLDLFFALQWSFISILFVFVEGLFVIYGVRKKIFSNYDVSDRKQRPPLFIFTGILCLLYLAFILLFNGPRVLIIGLGGLILGVIIAIVVNQKIKASIHMEAFTAFAVTQGILYGGWWWALIILVPIVAWSRLTLRRHSLPEVLVGTTLGAILVFGIFAVLKYFIM